MSDYNDIEKRERAFAKMNEFKEVTPQEFISPRDLRQTIAMHWDDDDPEGQQELASFDALVEKAACWDKVHELIKTDGKGIILGYHNAEKKELFGAWLQRSPYHTGSPTLEEAINNAPMDWRDEPCPGGINCGPCLLPCCTKGKRLKPDALCHHKCPSHRWFMVKDKYDGRVLKQSGWSK